LEGSPDSPDSPDSPNSPNNPNNSGKEDDYFQYYPTEVSLKNLGHFAQCELAGKFQKFDYGPQVNLQKYGQAEVPEYDLKLNVSILLEP